MLGLGAVCVAGGLCAKYLSSSLAVEGKDLERCSAIGIVPPKHPSAPLYGHFRGVLSSDQPNKVQDKDSGIEFDVVGVRKIVVELFEDKTKTTNLDTGDSTEVTQRGEKVLSDTGKQHFGRYTLKATVPTDAGAKKLNHKDSGFRHVECVLSSECQRQVPFDKAFSNYQPAQHGVTVVVNNSDYAKNRKKGRGLHEARAKPRLDVSVSRERCGMRTDVFAAKVGSEVTVIGDFTPNQEKTAWIAVPSSGRLTDVTLKSFEQYKEDRVRRSTMVNNIGTGLIVVGSAFGIAHIKFETGSR